MTWYATEILAAANETLLDYVKTYPMFKQHAYLIREPLVYQLDGQQKVFNVPVGGLLVLRPICDAADMNWVNWHNGMVLDWDKLAIQDALSVIEPDVFNDDYGFNSYDDWLPPAGFLRFLKKLAADTQANLLYFYSTMWGGDTDLEYAWFFGHREEALMLTDPDTNTVARTLPDGSIAEAKMDILSEALVYLGAPPDSPFCILHTRNFEWDRFKISFIEDRRQ